MNSIYVLTDLLAIVQPSAFGRAQRMRQHAADLAERVGMHPRWDVEVAALLSQLGSVTLDAELLERWYHCKELTAPERAQVDRLPQISVDLIASIPRLSTVCTMPSFAVHASTVVRMIVPAIRPPNPVDAA